MSHADVRAVMLKEFIDDSPDITKFPYLEDRVREVIGFHLKALSISLGNLWLTAYRVEAATKEALILGSDKKEE